MGSRGKRKGRRTRSGDGRHEADPPGFPEFQWSGWSTGGELERWAAFGRGLAYSKGRKRGLGLTLSVVLLVLLLFSAVGVLIALLQAVFS